jgi:hypothetical protein
MKWYSLSLFAALALAMLCLLVSAPVLSFGAHASIMNGKGSFCSDTNCRGINSPTSGKKKSGKKAS